MVPELPPAAVEPVVTLQASPYCHLQDENDCGIAITPSKKTAALIQEMGMWLALKSQCAKIKWRCDEPSILLTPLLIGSVNFSSDIAA